MNSGLTPGYPRFRGVGRFDSVEFPKDGDGCRWDSVSGSPATRVRFQGVGHVRVHQHRALMGRIKTVSVKREGTRWYVVVSCDDVPAQPLPHTGRQVGIDMGVVHFLTTSGGDHISNPRHGKRNASALADAQRALKAFPKVRRDQRSARHRRAVAKVAELQRTVRRRRIDHAHKTALDLVRTYDGIAHEKLNIAGMVRAPKPQPDPVRPGSFLPNGAAAKGGLNRSILDAGWGCSSVSSRTRLKVPVVL